MMSFASCFKGPEAKSSMEMEAISAACRGNEQKPSAGPGASNNEILCEMLLFSGTGHFIQGVSLKSQERMGSCGLSLWHTLV